MKNNIKSLSVVVPVFNEENTILKILEKLKQLEEFCDLEIIIVNDGSSDNSEKIILNNEKLYNKLVNLNKNYGKGKAVIEGLRHCSKEYIIIQDADLEYEPDDIKIFIKQLKEYEYDIIMGSRFIGNKRSVLHFWHMLGNKMITFLFNFLNNTTFTDIYCCYCLFKKELIDINRLKCNGWGQQAEILSFIVSKKRKIFEIGVNYKGRDYDEGKKIRYYDVFSVIYWIIISRLKKVIR